MEEVSLADFKKTQLRTARILDVLEIPGADKIWRLSIDLGTEKREIVAGIKTAYPKEALIGKSIIVVVNLAPAVIRGVESRGMLLAAKNDQQFSLITLDREMAPGSVVG